MSGIRGANEGLVVNPLQLQQTVVNGLEVYNKNPDQLLDALCEKVYQATNRVAQAPIEFGKHGEMVNPDASKMKFREINVPLGDYDADTPFSKIGFQDALESDIKATIDGVFKGDTELMMGLMMASIFTKRTAGAIGTAYQPSFWNGELDVPTYGENSFSSAHYHYKGLNTTTVAESHIIEAVEDVQEHGFGMDAGSLIAIFNTAQQSDLKPLMGTAGQPLPGGWERGMVGVGARYYEMDILFSQFVPAGYFAVLDKSVKPIAMREHLKPEYRGLQLMPGSDPTNPLVESQFLRRVGFAPRILGAGAVRQIVASATYTNPTMRFS